MENRTFIIAEAGVNHNGSLKNAYRLIEIAKDAGADAVKFQTFIAEQVVSVHAEKAAYQKNNTEETGTQLEMIKNLELSFQDFRKLNEYSKEKGILFLSTAFDLESITFLKSLNLPYGKIPSGEITNLPYLKQIASCFPKMILSTGMSTYEEISQAILVLTNNGLDKENLILLHCNTEYPTPIEDVNLLAMIEMKSRFNVEVGYSDHTLGIEVPIAATALGATVIEKHFTIDKSMPGPDHAASLEPDELKQMVAAIRKVEVMLGNPMSKPTLSEIKNRDVARKSIVAKKTIKKGELLTIDNITIKRPGTGISPMKWDEILGQISEKDYDKDQLINL